MTRSLTLGCTLLFVVPALGGEPSASFLAPGAKVQKLADGFRFTEGPACDKDGNVYFTDIPNNRIHKWSTAGKLSTFRDDSGGANGLFFDKAGNLLACEGKARRVTSISPAGKVAVLADGYGGKKLNSPNDLWIDPAGGVYFSDPRYGSQQGLEQGGFHVYYISPDRKQVTRAIDDLVKPNGVVGTSDGKLLYVADAGDRKTYVYKIGKHGKLTDRKLFCRQGSDGMTLDADGHVYLTSGAVQRYNGKGKLVETIKTPERPSNVVFGGKNRTTLFITARTGFYAVETTAKGQ